MVARILFRSNFWGNLHICKYYVHTRAQGGVVQECAFDVIKNPTHTCSLYIRVSFRITMKTDGGAMAK